MPKPKPCPSGKRKFASRAAAAWALILGHILGDAVYRCPKCHTWHTTSKAQFKPANGRR